MLKKLDKYNMEQILQHITDEEEIQVFHKWIAQLCNPDSRIVQDSEEKFQKILDEAPMTSTTSSRLLPMPGKDANLAGIETEGQKLMRKLANKYVRILNF